MPRINTDTHPMTRLLWSYKITCTLLASAIGCSNQTALNKIKDPKRLTIGDLVAIHNKLGVPWQELRERVE